MKKQSYQRLFFSLTIFTTVVFSLSFFSSCSSTPSTATIPAITTLDLNNFTAKWYEIARIPIPVAQDWVGTSDTYVSNADGTWTVLYEGYKGTMTGEYQIMKQVLKIPDISKPGEMLASPLPFIWLPYRLIYMSDDQRKMLVTSSTIDYLWIMSKDSIISDEAYLELVNKSKDLGFDIKRIEKVLQK